MKRLAATTLTISMLLLSGCGSESTQRDGTYDPPKAAGSASATPSSDGTCVYTKDPSGPASRKVDFPPATPAVTADTTMVIATNAGAIPITLTPKTGPCAVNSFVSLAKQKYFDKTPCHRIAVDPGFQMLQCGDPTGQGTGGPGYVFNQQVNGSETYPAGTIAMANTGQPNSEGSQFFLVFGDTQLPPQYTVFGTIDKSGLSVLRKIAKQGISKSMAAGGGTPKKKVEILSVR